MGRKILTEVLFHTTENKKNVFNAWDYMSGTCLASYKGHGSASANGFAVGGGYAMLAMKGKPQIYSWPLNKATSEPPHIIVPEGIHSFALSPNGASYVAVGAKETLFLYQTTTGKYIGKGICHFQPISSIIFSSDGCMIACGGEDGFVSIWLTSDLFKTMTSPEPIFCLKGHSLPVIGLAFTHSGLRSKVISCSMDKTLQVFDLVENIKILTVVFESIPTSFAVLNSYKSVFIGHSDGSISETSLCVISKNSDSTPTFGNHKTFQLHTGEVSALASSADSSILLSGSHDCTIKVWNIISKQCMRVIKTTSAVRNLCTLITDTKVFKPEHIPRLLFKDKLAANESDEDVDENQLIPKFHVTKLDEVASKFIIEKENAMKMISPNLDQNGSSEGVIEIKSDDSDEDLTIRDPVENIIEEPDGDKIKGTDEVMTSPQVITKKRRMN